MFKYNSGRYYSYGPEGLPIHASIVREIPDAKSTERIATLRQPLLNMASRHIRLCADEGIYVRVTQADRTDEQQDALYALGRTAPGKIVTKAKAGYSWHNFKLAYDVVILEWSRLHNKYVTNWNTNDPRWTRIGELGEQIGMKWGGRWKKFPDYPHFEFHMGMHNLEEARDLKKRGVI